MIKSTPGGIKIHYIYLTLIMNVYLQTIRLSTKAKIAEISYAKQKICNQTVITP
jgi:hypothetical protein